MAWNDNKWVFKVFIRWLIMRDNIKLKEQIDYQIKMNKISFEKLLENGLSDTSKIIIDFFYYSKNEKSLQKLKYILYEETDYDIELHLDIELEVWVLTGQTKPTKISLEILNQWIEWMCTVWYNNWCDFDGWGTEL